MGTITTTTVAQWGSVLRQVRCEKCRCEYFYRMWRRGTGKASTFRQLEDENPLPGASTMASLNLHAALRGCDPVACPDCGWYQDHMVREIRWRSHRWLVKVAGILAGLAIAGGGFGILCAVEPHRGDPPNYFAMQIIVVVMLALLTIPTLIRRILLQQIHPNSAHPRRPVPIPGTPVPFRRGEAEPVAAHDEPITDEGNRSPLDTERWFTVQLGAMPLPETCCRCLSKTNHLYKHPHRRLVKIPLRLCTQCETEIRNSWFIATAAGILVPSAIAATLVFLFAADPLEMKDISNAVAPIALLSIYPALWLGKVIAAPVWARRFNGRYNTVRIRFKNPDYAPIFAAERPTADAPVRQASRTVNAGTAFAAGQSRLN